MGSVLEVRDLSVTFQVDRSQIRAVRGLSCMISEDQVLALIGETGCGKSVSGNAIIKLLPDNASVTGQVYYKGQEIMGMREKEFRRLRGKEIAWIPQNPGTSLDPLMKVGSQVAESISAARPGKKKGILNDVHRLFERMQLPFGKQFYGRYPCELSGGMRQRVLVSMGVCANPSLLIVDEPTKAIDWALRKNVLDILLQIKRAKGTSMLLITHDIPLAAALSDRIAVMYCGEIVETGDTSDVLGYPKHPYTEALIGAMPFNGFKIIQGFMPPLGQRNDGCGFAPRCPQAGTECHKTVFELKEMGYGHYVRCGNNKS